MPIPGAESAIVPAEKVTDYLLNLSHPVGGPKAQWFHHIGFDAERPEELVECLLDLVRQSSDFECLSSPFGIKYTVPGEIVSPSQRRVVVVTVWIVEAQSGVPRLVSAYPGEINDSRA